MAIRANDQHHGSEGLVGNQDVKCGSELRLGAWSVVLVKGMVVRQDWVFGGGVVEAVTGRSASVKLPIVGTAFGKRWLFGRMTNSIILEVRLVGSVVRCARRSGREVWIGRCGREV